MKPLRLTPPVRTWSGSIPVVLLALAAALVGGASASAAGRYEKDDAVEVFFLNEWRPGTVLQTNARGEALVEYEFAGGKQQRVFKPAELRFQYESGALVRTRIWRDASGQFQVKAALLAVDAESVTLRQPDMTELKVPVAKLSSSDQSFLKKLEMELGPAAPAVPALPPAEDFAPLNSFGNFGSQANRTALPADPVPEYLKIPQGGVGFPSNEFFEELVAVLPVGGPEGWVLAAMANQGPGEAGPGRILWASLKNQKIEHQQVIAPGEIVLDYHPPSRRLLTYASVPTEENSWGTPVLTLWEVMPTDKEVKMVVRWNAEFDRQQQHAPWGRVVDGNIVISRAKSEEFIGWDISAKKMLYRITQESFFHPDPTFSGGRRYLYMPDEKAVLVYETSSGRPVSKLPAEDGSAAVAISPDGRKAAVLGRNTLTVWDVTDAAAEPEVHKSAAIGTPFGTTLAWVDPDHVMADVAGQGQVLYRLSEDLSLWSYQFDGAAIRKSAGQRVRDIVDGHLVFAAAVSAGGERGFAVGALKLPGPRVEEVVDSLDRDSLLVVKPGSAVRLEVRAGADSARIQQALLAEVEKNGWVVDPSASIVIVAEMKRGETQQVTYRSGFGPSGSQQTATVTPHISQLKVYVGNQVAWQTGTSTGAPSVVSLEPGQSVQNQVNRWQNPNPQFFDSVDIPDKIFDPQKRNGLGVTRVTTRGFEVVE